MTGSVALPAEDSEYLAANYGDRWSIISEGPGKHGLLIEDFSVPEEYDHRTSTLMILLPSGYPGSALDMFYFDPPLARSDGAAIDNLAAESHFARSWQRWSRHYGWEAGVDSLVSHVEYVKRQLRSEVGR